MRARNIKPGFFKNPDLADLTFELRLLFQGLWCLADCEGRLKDDHRIIKAEVFPYDNLDTADMLERLAKSVGKFITRYKVGDTYVIQINNFEKHQNPHKKEKETGSQLPPRPELAPEIPGQDPVQTGTGIELAGLNPESPFLNPESNTPKKKFSEEDNLTAFFIYQKLERLNPSMKKPNLNAWADDIRKMRELDERTDEQIRKVFTWANQDKFWQANILSPDKLREKYDQLVVKINTLNGNPNATQAPRWQKLMAAPRVVNIYDSSDIRHPSGYDYDPKGYNGCEEALVHRDTGERVRLLDYKVMEEQK